MIVKTINPVTINRKRVSDPSMYLNADGIQVKTINPITINNKEVSEPSKYLSFDASGKPVTKAEIQQFQNWLDAIYPTWLKGGKLNGGSGYGTFGPSTSKAWGTYGADFVKSLSTGTTPTGTTPTGTTPTTPTAEPTKDEKIANAKLGKIWDKTKGWITSDKAKDVLKSLTEGGGIMGAINALLGGGSDATPDATVTGGGTTTETTKEGLSKGAKIGIAVGSVVILGIIIYAVTRPKNK